MNTVLVLNTQEAEHILKRRLSTHTEIEEAAIEFLSPEVDSILITGEQCAEPSWVHDYWTNGQHSFWLTHHRYGKEKYPQSSRLSALITDLLTQGYTNVDAIVIAKMYVHRAIRLAEPYFAASFPEDEIDLPYLSTKPLYTLPQSFKRAPHLGLYPIVDSAAWVERLLKLGVKTIQLRIKERNSLLDEEIKRSIAYAKQYQAILFINDYWDLALKYDAEAIHLGQSDLETADLKAIRSKGLLLGISTHCYYEVARAHAIAPSYIAIGPVYPTTSKEMPFSAQGIMQLKRWQRTLTYPLVAIGGINHERMADVVATGVSGIALISAITQAKDPELATQILLQYEV